MVSHFCLTFKLFETVFAAAEKLFPLQNSNFFLMHLSPNILFANFRCYNPCHTGILYEETVVKNFVHFTCYYSCLSNTYLYSYLRWHRPLSDYLQPFSDFLQEAQKFFEATSVINFKRFITCTLIKIYLVKWFSWIESLL